MSLNTDIPLKAYLVQLESRRETTTWYMDIADWIAENIGDHGYAGWKWPWDRWLKKPKVILQGSWCMAGIETPRDDNGMISKILVNFAFKKSSDAILFKLTWGGK